MSTAAMPMKLKSLRNRLLSGFVLCAALIWICLVSWGAYSLATEGKRELTADLDEYARQVLSVVSEFRQFPNQLASVFQKVELIEREGLDLDDDDKFYIQAWIGDQEIRGSELLPVERPTKAGFSKFEKDEVQWIGSVAIDSHNDTTVRVVVDPSVQLTLTDEQWIFLFLPLIFSLPLLLLPAWFMTRRGLAPLREVVGQIDERVDSGELNPLVETPWRELNPIVQATNSLMRRLDRQIVRERAFVADVAHEMKTPLAIMQSNVGILESSTDQTRRKSALSDLAAGIERGNHLIRQLLRMSRMELRSDDVTSSMRELDVAEFIRERVAQAVTLAGEKDIQLQLQAPASLVMDTDVDAIAAVVDNLLDNAIKYSPRQTTVSVSVTRDDRNEDQWITLRVEDEGPGIPAARRDQAFARFGRVVSEGSADTDIPGAGLGLSIVRQAVSRLNGDLSIESMSSGPGLKVRVSLPIHHAALT